MRLIGLAMVKNESDVIEAFIRHNLRFLDAIYVIDNDSVDGTHEILVELEREGLPLVIFEDPQFGYFQSEKMTALYRNVCEYTDPDFVFLLDADEFIASPSRSFVEESLAALPAGVHGLLGWKTYLLSPSDATTEANPLRRMTYHRKTEHPVYYKVVIAADANEAQYLSIAQGNHSVFHQSRMEMPHQVLDDLFIAHFPVRSPTQLVTKVLVGWLAYLAKDPNSAATDLGYQWHDLYRRLMEHPELSFEEASAISLNYAQLGEPQTDITETNAIFDPLPTTAVLQHHKRAIQQPLITITRTIERALAPKNTGPFAPNTAQSISTDDKNTVEGTWEATFHHERLFLDLPPFRYIAEKYQPQQVLDLGCGLGGYIRMFQEWGAKEVLGVEGGPPSDLFLSQGNFLYHDLREPLDLQRTYDLVVCTEVVDHIDEQYEHAVIETIHRHARERIFFSAAEPGQPGIGHLNCKPLSYWLAHWQEFGWVPDVFDSLAVRSLATFSWLRRNPVVLVRRNRANAPIPPFSLADLERLTQRSFNWYSQNAAIYMCPFSEPLPSLFLQTSVQETSSAVPALAPSPQETLPPPASPAPKQPVAWNRPRFMKRLLKHTLAITQY